MKKKKWIVTIALSMLSVMILLYLPFVRNHNQNGLRHIPFSGKIFSITAESLNWFEVSGPEGRVIWYPNFINGTQEGESDWIKLNDYRSGERGVSAGFPDPEADVLAEKLNSLKYSYWLPTIGGSAPSDYGEGSWSITLNESTVIRIAEDCAGFSIGMARYKLTPESVETLKEVYAYVTETAETE